MKKALIALLVLSMIGTAAFAEDVVKLSASGDAQMWWGADLTTGATGFKIVSNGINLTASIGASQTLAKSGEGMYGFISIGNVRIATDFTYNAASNDWGKDPISIRWDDVVAKLVFGPASVTFFQTVGTSFAFSGGTLTPGDPGIADDTITDAFLQNAIMYDIYDGDNGGSDINFGSTADSNGKYWNYIWFRSPANMVVSVPTATNGWLGVDINFTMDKVLSAGVVVNSDGTWGTNTNNYYAFKGYFSLLAVDGLTLTGAANYSNIPGAQFGVGGRLAYAIKAGDLAITPTVGCDMLGARYGITGGLRVEMMKSTLTANFGIDEANVWTFVGAFNVGMVDGLTLQAALELNSVNAMGVYWNLGYALKADAVTVSPYIKGSFDNQGGVNSLYAKVGADITGVMANTTFMVRYDSDDFLAATIGGGTVSLGAKVSF